MTQSPVMDLVFGSMPPQLLRAAAELRLPDLLAAGPRTARELAADAGADELSVRRLLRALAGLGLVAQTGPDRFALEPAGRELCADGPGSVRDLVLALCGPEMWQSWAELPGSVRTGEPGWERAHGMPQFAYYAGHPEQSAVFNAAMAEHTRAAAPPLLAACDLARFGTVLDVGGGDGTLLAEALLRVPALEGVLFDLPQGLDRAHVTLAAAGVADRCRIVAGDFFQSVPKGADAYLMKYVLHDWDDARATTILRTCREAMAPDARLLVLERVLPELASPDYAQTLLVDMVMLAGPGGRERTAGEYESLLAGADLELVWVSERLAFDYRVVEAVAR